MLVSLTDNQSIDEPYTLDPAVLYRVLDSISDSIERVQVTCKADSDIAEAIAPLA